MLWAILAFIIVGSTKYVTSMRLRALHERMQQDHQVMRELRHHLSQVGDKEEALRSQAEALVAKVNALTNVVHTLERALSKSATGPPSAPEHLP
jgi:predicted  nucleic acid-binding Zn-ribbon protein